jgi:biotin carboxyl carrier protein
MRRFVNGDEVEFDPNAAEVTRDGDRLLVRTPEGTFSAVAVRVEDAVLISYRGRRYEVRRTMRRSTTHHHAAEGEFRAPMPGVVVEVRHAVGDQVAAGDVLVVLEAMKTHQTYAAPFAGCVTDLPVRAGQTVAEGDLLAVVEEESDDH